HRTGERPIHRRPFGPFGFNFDCNGLPHKSGFRSNRATPLLAAPSRATWRASLRGSATPARLSAPLGPRRGIDAPLGTTLPAPDEPLTWPSTAGTSLAPSPAPGP